MKDFYFSINIDSVPHYQKPDNNEFGRINNRIQKNQNFKTIDFDTFCEMVGEKGHSFLPSYFKNEHRTNANWQSQFCFAVDIDNGETLQEALDTCFKYKIVPNLIYTTFSHTEENHRFRIVWFLDEVIEDVRIQRFIQLGLMRFFKNVDKSCQDRSRMFAGGNSIFYKNETSYLSVVQLFLSLNDLFRKDNNAAKNTLSFARDVGVNIINGYLDCKIQCDDAEDTASPHIYQSSKKNIANSIIIYNRGCKDFLTHYIINFTNTYSTSTEQFEIEQIKSKRELIRNFDFENLENKCQFFKDSLELKVKVEHNEMFGLFTNLLNIQGSDKYVKQICDNVLKTTTKNPEEKITNIKNTINQIKKVGYKPMQCCNFCPYYQDCHSESNMINYSKLGKYHKNQAVQIDSDSNVREIEDIRTRLNDLLKWFFEKDTNNNIGTNLYVVKAPTGIGKTETFINSLSNYGESVVYAAPTHKLLKNVSKRLTEAGYVEDLDFMCYPELPEDFENKDFIEKLYKAGAHRRAAVELKKIAETNKEIKEYLIKKDKVDNFDKIILITHSRLIYAPLKKKPKKYIIDEDIFLSTMFPVSILKVQDLMTATEHIRTNHPDFKHLESIKSVLKDVQDATEETIKETPKSILLDKEVLTKYIAELIKEDRISSNLLNFYNSECYVKCGEYITYINKNSFNFGLSADVMVLSATVNEFFVKTAFKDASFVDLGQAKYKGKLYQVPSRSLSRSCINKNKEGYKNYTKKLCRQFLGEDYNLLTFPEFLLEEKTDIEKQLNLWNCLGLDNFQDKNLAIVGTPHCPPVVYYLMANVLGLNTNVSSTEHRPIERNGFNFYFNTYSENQELAEIQLYLIESVLMQAVGRARLVNNADRNVLLLSNLMLPQANAINYSNKEIKELME